MKTTYAVFFVLTSGFFLTPAATDAGELQVGVVRIQQVFKRYEYAIKQEKAITESFKPEREQIKRMEADIRERVNKIRGSDMQMLPPDSPILQEKQLEIRILEVRLNNKLKQLQKLQRHRMAEFWRSVYTEFRKAVDAIATRHGYDLIITAPDADLSAESRDSSAPESIQNEILLRNIQYIGKRIDLTDAIVEYMNANQPK